VRLGPSKSDFQELFSVIVESPFWVIGTSNNEGERVGTGMRWTDDFGVRWFRKEGWAISGRDGTGGGLSCSSLSCTLLPLNRRIKPLFLCLSDLPAGKTGIACGERRLGSESRLSTLGCPTIVWKAVFALAPALIERPRALEVRLPNGEISIPWGDSVSPGGKGGEEFEVPLALDILEEEALAVELRILCALASSSDMRENAGIAFLSVQPGSVDTPEG